MASITRLFIKEHRREILECLYDLQAEINIEAAKEEQQAVYCFAKAVSSVLATMYNVPTVLCSNKTYSMPSERKARLLWFDEVATYLSEYCASENIELVFDFITTSVISDYMSVSCQYLAELLPGMAHDLREVSEDNDGGKLMNAILNNKPSDNYLETSSKFLFVERLCFVAWLSWKGEGHPIDKSKQQLQSLYERFSETSWFSLLLNIDDNPENLDYTLNGIIEDYTGIKDNEASSILYVLLLVFASAIRNFKKGEEYVVEQDDREHVCGFCFPEERSYFEWRIKIVADYVAENGYIDDNDKDLFSKIMSGSLNYSMEFKHGKTTGEPKKKGGKTVLYWIIRYIREPKSFYKNEKSESYKELANCFYFISAKGKEPCNFTSLADSGKRSPNVAEDLRKLFKKKEKEYAVDITE